MLCEHCECACVQFMCSDLCVFKLYVRMYVIKEFRCIEAKIEESEKARSRTHDTAGLSRQCSATEPRQPDNHQLPQSSICTAQVVLNASVTHPAATPYVPSELC